MGRMRGASVLSVYVYMQMEAFPKIICRGGCLYPLRKAGEYLDMARPRKWRRVCGLPENSHFGPLNTPLNHEHFIIMSVDEYETVRLIDLEGLTQEECAERMNVARTTVQRIYSDARKKVAESLVEGKILRIEGGDYEICNGLQKSCGAGRCHRHRLGKNGGGFK